jgi:site-specific DNA-methyltransferase (adenine-specific)
MTTVLPNLVADRVPSHGIDLRLGDYREVLADVECDALIVDPPYGARTHAGNAGRLESMGRAALAYAAWTPLDVERFVRFWSDRVSGWMACMTSDDLIPVYRDAYASAGRADFAPVPILQHRPRLSGDGPGSCAVYLLVARPRLARFMSWGSLPGWYESRVSHAGISGSKPRELMQALVRDYSRSGDLVCDPCAGSASTLLAAVAECRRAVGAEAMPEHHALALAEIARGVTPSLFGGTV